MKNFLKYRITEVNQLQMIFFWATLCLSVLFTAYYLISQYNTL